MTFFLILMFPLVIFILWILYKHSSFSFTDYPQILIQIGFDGNTVVCLCHIASHWWLSTVCRTRSRKYDHITPILQSQHWLPIKFRISYKILLLAYKALNDLAPAYLTNLLSRYNPTRSLRSQNSGLLVVPRIAKSTKGGRTFSYLAPKLWNSLPDNVRVQTHSLCLNLD